jgi:hypothetical protein
VSQAAAQSRPLTSESETRLVALEQDPREHNFLSKTFRLFLAPLHEPSTTIAAVQSPTPFSFATRRFTIFPAAHDKADFPVFTASGVLYGPARDITDLIQVDMSVMTLSMLPLLAWTNYRSSGAWQFRLSRFGVPVDSAPLPFAITRAQLLSQPHTLAQVHGALAFGTRNHGVLHYALYAGVFAEETPRDVVAGASIGYAVGTTGFTLGIGYLYGPQAVGLDIFGRSYTNGIGYGPGSDLSVLISRLPDSDRLLIESQLLHGVVTSERTPLAVQTRSVLYINHRWAVYHRFDRFYLGQGFPKISEHMIGVRFLPLTNVSLHAEVMMGGIDDALGNAGGVRFAGTIYF